MREPTLVSRSARMRYPLTTVVIVDPSALLARTSTGAVRNVAFADARRLMEALGFELLRVRGSHHVYGRRGVSEFVNLQEARGQANRQVAALVRRYDLEVVEPE